MSNNEMNSVPQPSAAPAKRKVVVAPSMPSEGRVNLVVALASLGA